MIRLLSSLLKRRFTLEITQLTHLSNRLSPLALKRILRSAFKRNQGVAIALALLLAWSLSIGAAFSAGVRQIGFLGCLVITPWLTFLYTGLFVTGHDAMHGSVAPCAPKLNRALGELALLLYGLIPYETLHAAHAQHHRHPATYRDPDFHNGYDAHPLLWYFRFMRSYWTLRQTIGLVLIYNSLHRLLGVPESNLLMFWAVPSLLSSVQLFYFGTYLVHRKLPDTYSTPLCANSNYWPWHISLITCYHFGYHREHHAFPDVPWWQLPQVVAGAAYMTSVHHTYVSGGRTLATMSKPFVQRDRTRLNT